MIAVAVAVLIAVVLIAGIATLAKRVKTMTLLTVNI